MSELDDAIEAVHTAITGFVDVLSGEDTAGEIAKVVKELTEGPAPVPDGDRDTSVQTTLF